MNNLSLGFAALAALAFATSGCGNDDDEKAGATQTPPQGHQALTTWLAAGSYKTWNCEPAPVAQRGPSPHGSNRICANDLASKHTTGEYPVGAASVKELYNADGTLGGYALSLHTKAGKTGDSWYWYEVVPLDSPAPHDSRGVVADGAGDSGPAKSICVGCHSGAGSDAAHFGHDFVYVQAR